MALLNAENMQRGKHIAKSARIREFSFVGLTVLESVLNAGVAQGVFRDGVSAKQLYLLIASMGYFYLSNRYTLSAFLVESTQTPEALTRWHRYISQTVRRAVASPKFEHPTISDAEYAVAINDRRKFSDTKDQYG
jgi:TetR/AcrR family transcriptional regulator, upper aerobic nicotinate degradation pathway regulator